MVLLWHRGNHVGSERKEHHHQKVFKSASRIQKAALKPPGLPSADCRRMSFGALEESETPRGEGGKQGSPRFNTLRSVGLQNVLKAEAVITTVYTIVLSLISLMP